MIKLLKELMQNLLDVEGIDITKNDYKNNENYSKIKDEVWCIGPNGAITIESFIECHFIEDYRIQHIYESIYDMGNNVDLSDTGCEHKKNYPYLSDIECKYAALGEEIAENLGKKDKRKFAIEFRDKIYKDSGRSGGLVVRLKKHLHFDIDKFGINEGKNEQEILKIIYFFYMLEKNFPRYLLRRAIKGKRKRKSQRAEHLPENNKEYDPYILTLFARHSLENIDNTFKDWPTVNGLITRYVKNSIAKELSSDMILKTKETLLKITREWTLILQNAFLFADIAKVYNFDNGLENLIKLLAPIPQKLGSAYNNEYQHTPIETLYLKILQHECRGKPHDFILYVNGKHPEEDYAKHSEYVEKIKNNKWDDIDVNKIESHIEANAPKLAEYVYLRPETTPDERKEMRRKIRRSKGKVLELLGFFDKHTDLFCSDGNTVSELLIVSCLQVIILDSSNEAFKYAHYVSENQSKRNPSASAALKGDKRPYDAVQHYLVRKVMNRWNSNLGRHDVKENMLEFEKVCDRILEKILERPNFDEMMEIHNYYTTILNHEFLIPEYASHIIPALKGKLGEVHIFDNILEHRFTFEQNLTVSELISNLIADFRRYLAGKGFEFFDTENKIRYVFLSLFGHYVSLDQALHPYRLFMSHVEIALINKETTVPITAFNPISDRKRRKVYDFQLVFNYEKSTCTMTNFKVVYDEQFIEKLEKLGVVILDL